MTRIRLLLLFICFDLNSQSFHPHFVNQIFVDGQLVYKDSFGVIDSSIKINYCDSNGLIVDSYKGRYLIEFNKFKVIFDISHLDSVTNLTNRCYTKIDINKITHLNWKRKFKRKSKIRLFAWYNSCESAYYTATLFKGKTIRFKL